MNRYKHSHTTAYKEESRLFYAAVALFFIVFSLYVYFVSSSIVQVVMRKEVDGQISQASTQVAQLETEYIEMQHSISNEVASLQGYVNADKKIFIDRTSDTLVLSRN